MKTKKRIVSLTLIACLAVSLMMALTGCGKKSLEDYMNSSAMQKIIDAYTEQYKAQGSELSMYAEGDDLHMDVKMTTVTAADDSEVAMYREYLETEMAGNSSTFVDMANQMKDACSNETVNVVVTYLDAAGTELFSGSYAADK